MFTKYNDRGLLGAFIACRVEAMLRTFRAGETERWAPDTPIISTFITLERLPNNAIALSHPQYTEELEKICIIDHVADGKSTARRSCAPLYERRWAL